MPAFTTLQEMVLRAHERMSAPVWDFVMGGSESETTLRRNRRAFDRLALVPEPFNDVRRIDCTTTLLGHRLSMPVVLAPMGSISLVDGEGALAATRAASEVGTLTFVSGVADPGIQPVADAATGPLVFTLYVSGDRHWLDQTLEGLADLHLAGIAMLADAHYYARRDRDLMSGVKSKVVRTRHYADIQRELRTSSTKDGVGLQPASFGAGVTWEALEYVKKRTGLPLIVKGLMSARAAARAIDHGADVIYVSNHGGRQLDHQPGTLDVLPEITDVVGSRAEIIVDGGCLRGADVIKSLALGAKAVGLGRLQALALAAGGSQALVEALRLLEEEVVVDMGLMGVSRLDQLTPRSLTGAEPDGVSHPLSPFPIVMERLYSTPRTGA